MYLNYTLILYNTVLQSSLISFDTFLSIYLQQSTFPSGTALCSLPHMPPLLPAYRLPRYSRLCLRLRAEVYNMVGTLHYVHIMLDDNDGMAAAYQCIKGFQQFADVVEVQAGGRLVEDE